MATEIARLGRVVIDSRGLRRARLWGLFGKPLALRWDEITGWAVGMDTMKSRGTPKGQVLRWILELDHADGTEVIGWGRGENRFFTFMSSFAQQLPRLQRPARTGDHVDARLPPALARLAGPDSEQATALNLDHGSQAPEWLVQALAQRRNQRP